MSSFLQRLKSGATNIDNSAPPDNAGVVTRKLEKKNVSQPADQLGITFGNDAEVVSVAPRSPAAAANIPVNYMVFDVNGDFIENEQQFVEAARKNVNLVIKLQSTAGISELIARVLRDEELRASGAISGSSIDFDELLRTTPRFNFLSGDHPLFLRYNKRLKHATQAAALIAQRTQEAEQQRQQEIKERMRKALEEERAAQRRKEEQEEAERLRKNASPQADAFVNSQPFLKIIEDDSEFGRPANETKMSEPAPAPPVREEVATPEIIAPLDVTPQIPAEIAAPLPSDAVAPASAEELLALVGLPMDLPPQPAIPPPEVVPTPVDSVKATPTPEAGETVKYVTLPSEEYTLCSGERVFSVIKRRSGPVPPPPPGKPPTINKLASANTNAAPEKSATREDTSRRRNNSREHRYDKRRRSRSPPSRSRTERSYSSRDDSRRHRSHHGSSSRRDERSSRDSKYRR